MIDRNDQYDELRVLRLLFGISRVLDRTPDLRGALAPMLDLLESEAGLGRGVVTLLDRSLGVLRIEAAPSLSDEERGQGLYRLGEGLIGRVFETGAPVTVRDLSAEPRLLNRAGCRAPGELAGVSCHVVPIHSGDSVIGTLSAERKAVVRPPASQAVSDAATLEADRSLLEKVAELLADSAKLRERLQEDRIKVGVASAATADDGRYPGLGPSGPLPPSLSGGIVGTSAAMRAVFELVTQVAPSDATVLVSGESGTGKELVAAELHRLSRRADGPFVKVNCSALAESVIESELFGHERGAFTGAVGLRKGRFELAHGGTLFLDEIGELSPQVQIKLLRVLQEREIERVGGSASLKVDVRVIAATNRRLDEEVKAGRFREDLYYRLNVFPIRIPPLRERKSDIVLLADHFTEKYALRNDKPIKRISSPALDLFTSYHWPGNVRELENCIERAVILSNDMVIHSYHLPPSLQSAGSTNTGPTTTLSAALSRLEKELIVEALKMSGGNMAQAARHLGITERQMGLRVRQYCLNWKQYRPTYS